MRDELHNPSCDRLQQDSAVVPTPIAPLYQWSLCVRPLAPAHLYSSSLSALLDDLAIAKRCRPDERETDLLEHRFANSSLFTATACS